MADGEQHAARISLLGTVELAVPAGWCGGLPAQRRKVLALLAVNRGCPMSAEQMVNRLWEGEPPNSAAQMVRNQVNTLRHLLAPSRGCVCNDHGGYRLSGQVVIDAERFRTLVCQARSLRDTNMPLASISALRGAQALWRGVEALADVRDVPDLELEAHGLEELRFQAEEMLSALYLDAGTPEAALPVLEEMTVRHPDRELPWVRLMVAQALMSRRAEASNVTYRRAQHHLVEQTGLDAPLLDRVHLALLRGAEAAQLIAMSARGSAESAHR